MFQRLFTTLFNDKLKKGYLLLLIQIVGSLASSFFVFFGFTNGHFYLYKDVEFSYFTALTGIFGGLSFLALAIFFITTCVANEHTNSNQSYRLLPISDTKYYLDNILSSFVAVVFMGILELLGIVVLSIFAFFTDPFFKKNTLSIWHDIQHNLFYFDRSFYLVALQVVIMLILLIFLTYVVISFLNFSSSAILNFLPGFSSHSLLALIRGIIIIFISWLIIKLLGPFGWFFSFLSQSPIRSLINSSIDIVGFLGSLNLIFLIAGVVFLAADLFLFDKFFEPKERS